MAAYQPIFEQQLNLIKNPQELQKQMQTGQSSCAQEFAEAHALFQKFFTEDVAQRLLPRKRGSCWVTSSNGAGVINTSFAASFLDGWSAAGHEPSGVTLTTCTSSGSVFVK